MENIEKGKTPEWYLILALIWGVMGVIESILSRTLLHEFTSSGEVGSIFDILFIMYSLSSTFLWFLFSIVMLTIFLMWNYEKKAKILPFYYIIMTILFLFVIPYFLAFRDIIILLSNIIFFLYIPC